jgi:hypothetical protein
MDTIIGAGDQLIVISEDDDTIRLSGLAEHGVREDLIEQRPPSPPAPERTLLLGWNWRAPSVIAELDQYVAPGSTLTVVAEHAGAPFAEPELAGVRHQKVTFQRGDTTDRRILDGLDVGSYDHLILLCDSGTMSAQQADAKTLVTLLHLRDIATRSGRRVPIVSEMVDIRNRALAEVTRADDFIVSDRIVSLMLSQVAENKQLNAVFADLFDPEGSEIYLKPARDYVRTGAEVSFYTVVESARRKGEVAIGYRLAAHAGDAEKAYGVVVNPGKSSPVTFGADDRIVVLAEA